MITKAEWRSWKADIVTQRLLNVIEERLGETNAVLVRLRGEVGDFERGIIEVGNDIRDHILLGEDLHDEGEDNE